MQANSLACATKQLSCWDVCLNLQRFMLGRFILRHSSFIFGLDLAIGIKCLTFYSLTITVVLTPFVQQITHFSASKCNQRNLPPTPP